MKPTLKQYQSKFDNYDLGQRLADLKSVTLTQLDCTDGDNDYMRGMANAFLIAWNIMGEPYGAEVNFINPPCPDLEKMK